MLCLVIAKCTTVHYGFVCPKHVIPEILWFIQMNFCRPKTENNIQREEAFS